jgi:hypothetical protein
MSVFRAATNESAAYRRPEPTPPFPAGHRAPQQRSHDQDCPDGPTEPLGATREAVSRQAASQEAAAREAAVLRDAVPAGSAVKEAPPAAPAPEPRRGALLAAMVFSLVALLVSGAAGYFSWRTLEAARVFVPAHGSPQPVPVVVADLDRAWTSGTPAAESADVRVADPESYPVAYAKEPLRLQPACSAVLHLDLDEPRADAAEDLADLRYESGCGNRPPQLSLGPGAAGGSREASADTDAAGCDRAIRTSPLGRGLPVEVSKGTAVCVLTAATPAELVLVEIIDVGGSGTAGLRATSWQVP